MSTSTLGGAAARVTASNAATERFFTENAEAVARACHAIGARFQAGGRLLAYGRGAQSSDVAHVVVEFLHPVIVGKRALPAFAVADPADLTILGRDGDIFMLLRAGVPDQGDVDLLARARQSGMLALALTGTAADSADRSVDADFHLAVPSDDPLVIQEVHETLYHVLWELTHVFVEHRPVP